MAIHHNTPENPSSQEPYFEAKKEPFTSAVGTHAVDGSYDLPDQTEGDEDTSSTSGDEVSDSDAETNS